MPSDPIAELREAQRNLEVLMGFVCSLHSHIDELLDELVPPKVPDDAQVH
jgi:hypothetical protein